MTPSIRLDVSGMLRSAVPSGVTPEELDALAERLATAHEATIGATAGKTDRGSHGFLELEAQVAMFRQHGQALVRLRHHLGADTVTGEEDDLLHITLLKARSPPP